MAKTVNSSNTQKREQLKIQTVKKPLSKNWLDFINDNSSKPVIPIGPGFQANVPEWIGQDHKNNSCTIGTKSDESKWLGTRTWPSKYTSPKVQIDVIGKGRPDFCSCSIPGSVECVKFHVNERRVQLKSNLGPTFREWKFDEMGDEILNLWNLKEQNKFHYLVKMNSESQNKKFLKLALEHLPSKCRQTIAKYYFNVHVPRRMSRQSRSGCTIIDTDDEVEEVTCSNGSLKRRGGMITLPCITLNM